jgi:hypothetical protein
VAAVPFSFPILSFIGHTSTTLLSPSSSCPRRATEAPLPLSEFDHYCCFFPSSVSSPLQPPSSSSSISSHPSVDPSSCRNPSPPPPITGAPPPQLNVTTPKPFPASPMTGHHGGFPPTLSCPVPPHRTGARAACPALPHPLASRREPCNRVIRSRHDRALGAPCHVGHPGRICLQARPTVPSLGLK